MRRDLPRMPYTVTNIHENRC